MIDDLYRAMQSADALEQQAGLLALLRCPHADHASLRTEQGALCAEIEAGHISWESIGRAVSARRV
jgi:hypothetical protein